MFVRTMKNDCIFQQSSLAEDMGLEEVRIVQTLKFQGGKAPPTFVPGVVPNTYFFSSVISFAILNTFFIKGI